MFRQHLVCKIYNIRKSVIMKLNRNIYNLLSVVFLFVSLSGNLNAQDKKIEKVEKYYLEADYEKCINKSTKYSEKNPKTSEFYLFKSLSHFQIVKNTKAEHEEKRLSKKIISDIKKTYKYQETENQFVEYEMLIDSIRLYLINTADNLFVNHKSQSKYYYDNLAKIFNDTCENYYVFHPEFNIPKNIETDLKSDTNIDLKGKRKEMITNANELVGIKYVWAGEDPKGFDCSGFTMYLYKQIGYKLPHNAQMQSQLGITVPIEEAKPGDLIFFGYRTNDSYRAIHAGVIYANNNGVVDLVHCVSRGVNIDKNDNTNNTYWLKRALFVKRIIGEETCNQLYTDNN